MKFNSAYVCKNLGNGSLGSFLLHVKLTVPHSVKVLVGTYFAKPKSMMTLWNVEIMLEYNSNTCKNFHGLNVVQSYQYPKSNISESK